MSRRSDWLSDFSTAIAERRWRACPELLYRVLYGAPAMDLLQITAEAVRHYLPFFESRWPAVKWPRNIIYNPRGWIQQFGRALPDEPEFELISDARFKFSLDAILLAWSHPTELSILTSSCVCGIREALSATVQESTGPKDLDEDAAATKNRKSAPDPESPIELARSQEWQSVLDAIIARNIREHLDVQSTEVLEADLAQWESHEMLLIVPGPELQDIGDTV